MGSTAHTAHTARAAVRPMAGYDRHTARARAIGPWIGPYRAILRLSTLSGVSRFVLKWPEMSRDIRDIWPYGPCPSRS